jgi:outer membrane protein OmpA-like peptidoglycan-associated protein
MAVPVAAQSTVAAPSLAIDELADSLADCPSGGITASNPDGTAVDAVCTRQWVKGKVVRQDIQMSFDVGSADLTASARQILDRFAAGLLRIRAFRPFTVEGHTDSSGGPATNSALSRARAASVVDYLASKGVDRSRLTARGLSYDRPLPGRGADDPANRRVEIVAR